MVFLCKSKRLGKSLKTFGSQIFFLRFLKSIGWHGFSYGFWAVLKMFHQCFILINTNIHSIICCPLPPPCTVVLLCCDIMLVIDLPDSIGNLWPWTLLSYRVQKKKTNKKKLKLGLKYMYYNEYCMFEGMYISDFLSFYQRCSVLFCKIF